MESMLRSSEGCAWISSCHIDGVKVRDDVTLIGQDGDREVTVEEVAAPANSFNYELVCNISRRVPRTYIRDGRELGQVNYLLD